MRKRGPLNSIKLACAVQGTALNLVLQSAYHAYARLLASEGAERKHGMRIVAKGQAKKTCRRHGACVKTRNPAIRKGAFKKDKPATG